MPEASLTRVGFDGLDSLAEHDLDASLLELVLRVLPNVRLEHREQLRSGLDEDQPRLLRRHSAIVLREVASVELGQRTDALDAGGAAADDDDVERPVVDE